MKACPYCAEQIQDEAKKCRFCGEWLEEHDRPETPLAPSESQGAQWQEPSRSGWGRIVAGSLVVVAVIAVAVLSDRQSRRTGVPPAHPSPTAPVCALSDIEAAMRFVSAADGGGSWDDARTGVEMILIAAPECVNDRTMREIEQRIAEHAGTILGLPSPAPTPTPVPTQGPDLAVRNWRWSRDYGYAVVEGEVTNLLSVSIPNLAAIAKFYDGEKEFVTSGKSLVEYTPLRPGQTSPFKVMVRWNPDMKTAAIEFATIDGEWLSHGLAPTPTPKPAPKRAAAKGARPTSAAKSRVKVALDACMGAGYRTIEECMATKGYRWQAGDWAPK